MNIDLQILHIVDMDRPMELVVFHNIKILGFVYEESENEIQVRYIHTLDEYNMDAGMEDEDIFLYYIHPLASEDGDVPSDSPSREGFIIDGVEYLRGNLPVKEYYEKMWPIMHNVMVDNVLDI